MKLRSWLLFFLVVLLWGSNAAMIKIGLNFVSPMIFLLQRVAISVIALFPFFLLKRNEMPKERRTLINLLVLCLLFFSITLAQTLGLSGETSGIGAILLYTQPLFVFCLAIPLLKEKITETKLLGVVTGFMGVAILFVDKAGSFRVDSSFLMLFGAFVWALAIIHYKKFLSHVDPLIVHFLQLSVSIVPLVFVSLTFETFILHGDVIYLTALVLSSVGALAVGNVVWFHLLKEEEVTTVSGSTLVIPAVALLFGWQLLGEAFSTTSILGSMLILSGLYLLNVKRIAG